MKGQFDPTRYVVRKRFKYWSSMSHKPGESIQELAARIRHDAAIWDPLDEAMRTRFMCSVSNEAVLKALFKYKEEELTFAKAIAVAMETEEAAKVAKETVYGTKTSPVYWLGIDADIMDLCHRCTACAEPSEEATQACQPPMNASRKAMESGSCGSCHQFSRK